MVMDMGTQSVMDQSYNNDIIDCNFSNSMEGGIMIKIMKIIDVISLIVWVILGICMIIYKDVSVFTIATLWIVNFINMCTLFIKDLHKETRELKEETKI